MPLQIHAPIRTTAFWKSDDERPWPIRSSSIPRDNTVMTVLGYDVAPAILMGNRARDTCALRPEDAVEAVADLGERLLVVKCADASCF